ncbi:L-lactate permease, partial [Serinicoccus profundi]
SVVAAQALGGAGGNPVAIHNIIAASATVGLLGREGDLIRKTALITAYYCLAAGAISYLWIYGIGFNLGLLQLVLLVALLVGLTVYVHRRERSLAGTGVG